MNPTVRKLLPHLGAYLILLLTAFIYFSPAAFQGKELPQSDNVQALGMQAEARKYEAQMGRYPLWTNSMFSGMPMYQIKYESRSLIRPLSTALLLGNNVMPPHTAILLMLAGMYLLLVVLGVDWRIALMGALGFGFMSNFMDLVLAGHSTKLIALAYMAPTLAGILLAFRGQYLLGGGLTALFLALQLYANHVQITYYFMLVVSLLGLIYLIDAIRRGELLVFGKAAGVLVLAALLAASTSTGRLWGTYEYSQETIRGKSELTTKVQGASGSTAAEGGLSKEYAFGWSLGVLESYTLLIPNFMGGSSNENFVSDRSSATFRVLSTMPDPEQAQRMVQLASHYWGTQPFVGAPVYFGAVVLFLFFLGAFLVKGPLRNWILVGTLFTLMLSWGRNFPALNYFLFDYFPLYNKFRAVTMVLGITALLVSILGAKGLQAFFDAATLESERKKALYLAGGITGGLVLLALLLSGTFSYGTEGLPNALADALSTDRQALLRADALRSLLFVAAAFGLLWAQLRFGFSAMLSVLAMAALVALDMWGVGRRIVNSDSFVRPGEKTQMTQPSPGDQQIMQDKDLHYRVADFRRDPFSNAITSYNHRSVGGYHAAKLMRYQELIETYLRDPMRNAHLYGMLNAKYFIGQNDQVQVNAQALGNAWFVPRYRVVENADEEMAALADCRPAEELLVQKSYASEYLGGWQPSFDSSASIQLVSYHPDTLVYRYTALSEQLAVFSEVYYPPTKGWKVYINGQQQPDFIKGNYLLRAMRLPAGQNHELTMVFAPRAYYTGELISLGTSILVLLAAIGGFVLYARGSQLGEPNRLPTPPAKDPAPKARVAPGRKKR
jgi:hypothetical protein